MMNQPQRIAVLLFLAGSAVYLTMSGAPARVRIVTLTADAVLLMIGCWFAWRRSLTPAQRFVGGIAGVALWSAATTWLMSRVIAALNPLDARSFGLGFVASLVQALLFIGVVWLIDRVSVASTTSPKPIS
jgi:hypothetical protein